MTKKCGYFFFTFIGEQNMSGIFTQSPANRRRYGVAVFVGIVAGIISAFVKWGA